MVLTRFLKPENKFKRGLIMNLQKVLEKVKSNIKTDYLSFCKKNINENLVLLEGGQGSNINGNMFALLKELKTNPKWSSFKVVFVVTEKTLAKADARMKFYGFSDVVLVKRNSKKYSEYLATAKFLATDNSFPPYFHKRAGQIYLNTWHGTPLKSLGKSDKSNLASLANIQKNYLMSDYALFPNEFTKDVFMNDYDLKNIFKGNYIIANYPRNYIFYDKEQSLLMKENLKMSDKQVFCYMPTWRGTGRTADTKIQIEKTLEILKEFDEKLSDSQILLVNLHFLLASEINCNEFKHIKYFPSDYETYEILNGCDGLITDYSSVFFDFAITEKKIILFAYDKDEYLSSRGLYMPFEKLPFPILENVSDVISELSKPAETDKEFLKKFCPNGSRKSCEDILDLMVNGESHVYDLVQDECADKNLCMLYAGELNPEEIEKISSYINNNPDEKIMIVYRKNFTEFSRDFINSLPDNVSTYGTVTAFSLSFVEIFLTTLSIFFNKIYSLGIIKKMFKREKDRLFFNITPKKIVDLSKYDSFMINIMKNMTGEKIRLDEGVFVEFGKKKPQDVFNNVLPVYFNLFNKKLICFSRFKYKTLEEINIKDCFVEIDSLKIKPTFFVQKKKSNSHKGFYWFSINTSDLVNLPSNNIVRVSYIKNNGESSICDLDYFSFFKNYCFGLYSATYFEKKSNTYVAFRQMKENKLGLYVRSFNKSDKFFEKIKVFIAFVLSLFIKTPKITLLYEKNSSKYEESASVLFEELQNKGYKNAYFILDKNYEFIDKVPEKFRENIIYKNTFKHYFYFFKAKTFIGTEALVHAFDLKTFNQFALKKISSKNINYVFLQHGVMYMVSLDSESRTMFKRKELNGKYRVIVSSQAEADHFTTLGRHYPEDIYVSGLPKFDRNQYKDNADKIVIMPTWRPWEINTARMDFTQTNYYKMIIRIFDSVPENLKEKVVVLPHPLIVNELNKIPASLADKIALNVRYDDVLAETAVLITDYSSIAYDAFYRGARVIFYWEEKDYCMEQYGHTTKLMLNEENVFGDTFYDCNCLKESIEKNYYNKQDDEYLNRYSELVDFHDNRNTERLISFLEEDSLI